MAVTQKTAINFSIDPDSTSYQEYLAWVAEGNTAEAADKLTFSICRVI